jgi:hypothetical protein
MTNRHRGDERSAAVVKSSIGIWTQGDATGERVLYRWAADQQTGFVDVRGGDTPIPPVRRQRSADWGVLYDAATGDSQRTLAEVDRALFSQVVASLLRGYTRAGKAPTTARTSYYY